MGLVYKSPSLGGGFVYYTWPRAVESDWGGKGVVYKKHLEDWGGLTTESLQAASGLPEPDLQALDEDPAPAPRPGPGREGAALHSS